MKRLLLVLICFTVDAYAQNSAALSHVAAAKAAVSPSTPNAKPYQKFQSMFEQFCAEPKGHDVMRPDSERFKPLPRDQWYVPPYKIFDNLYFIGTKTAGVSKKPSLAGVGSTELASVPLVMGRHDRPRGRPLLRGTSAEQGDDLTARMGRCRSSRP